MLKRTYKCVERSHDDRSNEVWGMMLVSFGSACPRSNALQKKLVREHHEDNIELERYIER
jgi:hypothetical protein